VPVLNSYIHKKLEKKMINERTNEEVLETIEIEEMEEVFAPGIMLAD
jgi:hypothetical protein